MQDLSLDKQIRISLNEIFDKRRLCALSFAFISMAVVMVGLKWPETFESSTILLWDNSKVIKPLLEGTVTTNTSSEQEQIAKEVIYSNRNLETLIDKAELNVLESGKLMRDRDVEILKSELRSKILIERGKNNILRISYKNPSAEEAFLVVSIVSKLFIEETTQNQKDESFSAYQFIQGQVANYQEKLNQINKSIIDFKADNLEIQVDSTQGVNNRISGLNAQIQATSLELKEATIQRDSLVEQLMIESQTSTAEEVVTVRNERLVVLEGQLSTLRLSYTESYPDIVQIKEQIQYLQDEIALNAKAQNSQDDTEVVLNPGTFRSELYNRLKQQIADQETVIKTLESRMLDQQSQFEQEIGRSSEVNYVMGKLEELSRDQTVTKQLYDQLLIKLENARVSLNLELESAGSLFRVQEPPTIPLIPTGFRFLHFAIASVILGIGTPIALILAILQIDSRIRHGDSIDLGDGIPVLGQVASFKTDVERKHERLVTIQSFLVVSISLATVAGLSLLRYYETI